MKGLRILKMNKIELRDNLDKFYSLLVKDPPTFSVSTLFFLDCEC